MPLTRYEQIHPWVRSALYEYDKPPSTADIADSLNWGDNSILLIQLSDGTATRLGANLIGAEIKPHHMITLFSIPLSTDSRLTDTQVRLYLETDEARVQKKAYTANLCSACVEGTKTDGKYAFTGPYLSQPLIEKGVVFCPHNKHTSAIPLGCPPEGCPFFLEHVMVSQKPIAVNS